MKPSDHQTWFAGKSITRPNGPGWAMQKQKVMTSIDNNKTPRTKNMRTRIMMGACWVISWIIMVYILAHVSQWAIEEKRVLIWLALVTVIIYNHHKLIHHGCFGPSQRSLLHCPNPIRWYCWWSAGGSPVAGRGQCPSASLERAFPACKRRI